jgi:hypothetical protein
MSLEYFQGDERPYWQATVTIEGVGEDMSTGYTFEVNIAATLAATPVLTKTSGITGGPDGLVTVAWAVDDLDIPPLANNGKYFVQLTATRTSDNKDWTVQDKIKIKSRLT